MHTQAMDLELLHAVELARARMTGEPPLSPARIVELADLLDRLADEDPDGWVDALAAEADARAAADVGDAEPDDADTRGAPPSCDATRDQALQPAARAAGPTQPGEARRGTAGPLHSPGVGCERRP